MRIKNYILIALAVASNTACHRLQEKTTTPEPIPVEVLSVGTRANGGYQTYVGKLCPEAEYPIYYAIGGQLTQLHVSAGEMVRRGQAIADFDDTRARALYTSAQAVLQQAEDGHRRTKSLYEKGVVTEVKWIEMQTDLEKARQSVQAAAKSLSDCHLTAPTDGVIGSIDAHVGQQMMPGQTICTLLSIKTIEAEFTVPEQDVHHIAIGDTTHVLINALGTTCHAVIRSRNLTANPVAHTYTLRARLTDGRRADLRSALGGSVSVQLALADSDTDQSIVIPGRCVQTTPHGPIVWVVENGCAYRRSIVIGRYVADGIEVSSGLQPSDLVIISGYQKLYSAASISVLSGD